MAILDKTFNAIVDLNLWYKLKNGDTLTLADIPELLPLRWTWLRDNWSFMKDTLTQKADSYDNPQLLNEQIADFSNFVESQRYSPLQSNPLSSQNRYFQFQALFANISLEEVNPTNEEQVIINNTTNRISGLNRTDFFKILNLIKQGRDEYVDSIGGEDDTYNRIVGRSSVATSKTPSPRDIQELQSFMDAIQSCEFVLANMPTLDSAIDPFTLAKNNANNPDYEVQSHKAGVLAKMQYGDSLQDIALRFLGSADCWIEIAVTNGLKAPYIDEVGEALKLLSNAAGNKINIAKVDPSGKTNIDKFFINQSIFIQSDVSPFPEQRLILNIEQIPVSGEIVLELNGELDLERYTITDNAYIRIFKPNTTNSLFFITIPNDEEPPQNLNDVPWFMQSKAEDEKQTGIDLLITDSQDISFTASGDIALSYGLANGIQALQLKMITEQGVLNRHPDYGIVAVQGASTVDKEDRRSELTTSIINAVESDPRFSAVSQISVSDYTTNNATGFIVQLVVRLAGTGTSIPISFTINPS